MCKVNNVVVWDLSHFLEAASYLNNFHPQDYVESNAEEINYIIL